MRIRYSRQTNQGLTLIEAFVVIFIVAFIAFLLVPAFLAPHEPKAPRISCQNNLKQLALAMRVWAGDNNDRFPMAVSVTNGGAMELMTTPDAWKVFQVMSNELSTPKVIYCPADTARGRSATNFTPDLKNHVSYFIGMDATLANPQSLLSGDDNLETNGVAVKSGLLELSTNALIGWTTTRHNGSGGSGVLLLGDGSVQSTTISGLRTYWRQTGLATNRLFIP